MISTERSDAAIALAILESPEWYAEKVVGRLSPFAGCMVWTGALSSKGYGLACIPRAIARRGECGENLLVRVHRITWIATHGPIPDGMVVDHDGDGGCHLRACANPEHLSLSTWRQNAVVTGRGPSAINAAKTHCIRGHELGGDNVYPAVRAAGARRCRACDLDRKRGLLVAS